jgi:hypothetical protein
MKIEDLRTGDKVLRVSSYGTMAEIAEVERVTATRIVVRGAHYRRADGRAVGGSGGRYIRIPTSDELRHFAILTALDAIRMDCSRVIVACNLAAAQADAIAGRIAEAAAKIRTLAQQELEP